MNFSSNVDDIELVQVCYIGAQCLKIQAMGYRKVLILCLTLSIICKSFLNLSHVDTVFFAHCTNSLLTAMDSDWVQIQYLALLLV